MRQNAPEVATPGSFRRGIVQNAALEPDAETKAVFDFGGEQLNPIVHKLLTRSESTTIPFLVDVLYTDMAGGQATWARFHLKREAGKSCKVIRIDYLDDDGGQPRIPAFNSSEIS
jgi:hypothetical protein